MRQVRLLSRPQAPKREHLTGGRPFTYRSRHWGLGLLAPTVVVDVNIEGPDRDPVARAGTTPKSRVIDVAAVLRSQSLEAQRAHGTVGDSGSVALEPARIESMAWLEGCWVATSAQRTTEERWTAPRAGSMLGTSRTTRNDTLLEHEFMTLREAGGRLVYRAEPSGQAAAEFSSTGMTDSTVVFENPEHDFPQLIGYRRGPADSLHAWIEGPGRSGIRRVNFTYRRTACEP
jgi:hypothetical protein